MNDDPSLTHDCLIHIFSFFEEDDLITVSSVCKKWHEAADTPWLWREMCLQQWGFCNIAAVGRPTAHGKQPWKDYFLRRSHLERKMTKGRSGGYSCKTLRGHTGKVVGFGYLGNTPQGCDVWSYSPVVCSASADGTVRAWDIHKGEQLWCSPVQSPLTGLVVDAHRGVVVTADSAGVIKTWQGTTGQETASYSSASPQCTLLQFDIDHNSYVSVGTSQGSVHALTHPSLSKLSSLAVCHPFTVDLLLASPDRKWILAGTKDHGDSSPKVISSQSLVAPAEGEEPLWRCLAVPGCIAASFLPPHPARLAVVHRKDRSHNNNNNNSKTLSVFDIDVKKDRYKSEIQVQLVASFDLALDGRASDVLLEAKSGGALVVAADRQLRVYSLSGTPLASFTDHVGPITSICVDGFRVVTSSRDLSLRVLTWRRERGGGLTLQSRYHLLGGSHSSSRGFTGVACDYSSIVASTEAVDGNDVLKAYCFNS